MVEKRVLILLGVFLTACSGDDDDAPEQQTPQDTHAATITDVNVEIDYATNAEPYTGSTARIDDIWQLSQDNIQRLFPGKTLTLPHTLSGMQQLTDVTGDDFTSAQILAIADSHRDVLASDTVASFYIVWLDGYFANDEGRQSNVLGVTLGNTGVLAMFKPVIANSAVLPGIQRFVEQTTLIHEMGHAAGLVNNGITPVTNHQDTAHGAHCTNEDCVMYYLNEGASDVVTYATNISNSGSTVLFDDACLADIDSL